jgi:hypothetical protein
VADARDRRGRSHSQGATCRSLRGSLKQALFQPQLLNLCSKLDNRIDKNLAAINNSFKDSQLQPPLWDSSLEATLKI